MAVKKQKKDLQEWAKFLYLKTDITQEEIATRVGVTRKTIGTWIKDGNWEVLKSSFIITKEQELRRIYMQINELNSAIEIRDEGQRYATSTEADTLSKLSAAARKLETDTSIAEIVDVFIGFSDFLYEQDPVKAKEWVPIQDAYIKEKLRKY